MRDLGNRSLKDLTEPERIFQLVTPDLPSEFPPLNPLDARTHNLPAQPTPIGAALHAASDHPRLHHDYDLRWTDVPCSGISR